MRTWLFLALAAVAVAGCDKLPAAHPKASPWPDFNHRLPTTYRQAVALNAGEAERLKANPELGLRDGETLKIFHNGRLIHTAVSTDCDKVGADQCRGFYFIGPVAVLSPVTHKLEAYAQVGELFYEGSGGYDIPLENGKSIHTDGQATGSPDGHWLVSGEDVFDDQDGRSNLTIHDMTAQKPDIVFAPSCMPNEWTGPSQFTALCEQFEEAGDIRFEAVAAQGPGGQWTLTTTRILSYEPSVTATAPIDPHRVYPGKAYIPQPSSN